MAASGEASGGGGDWFKVLLPVGKLKKLPPEEEESILGMSIHASGGGTKSQVNRDSEDPLPNQPPHHLGRERNSGWT